MSSCCDLLASVSFNVPTLSLSDVLTSVFWGFCFKQYTHWTHFSSCFVFNFHLLSGSIILTCTFPARPCCLPISSLFTLATIYESQSSSYKLMIHLKFSEKVKGTSYKTITFAVYSLWHQPPCLCLPISCIWRNELAGSTSVQGIFSKTAHVVTLFFFSAEGTVPGRMPSSVCRPCLFYEGCRHLEGLEKLSS